MTYKQLHAQLYKAAGADGIFVPCTAREEDISAVTRSTGLSLNVMCMPKLLTYEKLPELGVKRISMANFRFEEMYGHFAQMVRNVKDQRTFSPVFAHVSN
ncbi:phosphoenolpyruvate phosphomutase-like protein [Pontibacter mucosus]|uniref:Phosphoenolpyruvate phosphomutase-like protein n=1 Tax=Pontibacter mucosus TaxID=1649266 RepID=A0A2T5Y5A8_9BACT|nr:isocitrate lyase/phosphoenolpyruvate mutase family protein [Pontibacter mucosus]PTX11409.1 phosphoenolpyruvate phosphomutase-like protein [Pontibacter mucosus]